eukprot:CAMPEP_0170177182 /NCGR_PEP_ID=MMETSP0040_2-20121228/9887_1 /TAXON_ID=641309 /ORGANISM="Lotharella oceanica, Strain CCMP622" /LENGTH=196 /DNA_ID=CAMNT_0010419735 /DNA_START=222 /DNA_END=813 /DNA_ORIENTATION=+
MDEGVLCGDVTREKVREDILGGAHERQWQGLPSVEAFSWDGTTPSLARMGGKALGIHAEVGRPLTIVALTPEGSVMATFPVRRHCRLTIVTPEMLEGFNQDADQEQNQIASTHRYMCMISGMPFDLIWGTNEKERFHAWCRTVYAEIHYLISGKERMPRAKYTFDGARVERKPHVAVSGDCCDVACDEPLSGCGCD